MIAIISDIHGNLAALEAVLSKIDQIGCERIISLGDVVGYYFQITECINLLISRNVEHLTGNHDQYLIDDSECPRSKIVAELIKKQKMLISSEHLKWLSSSKTKFTFNNKLFLHGSPDDPVDGYIYEVSERIFPLGIDYLFCGHTHVQKLAKIGNKIFCNPGSVGQPRDGNPHAAFAILDNEKIKLYRVEYDFNKTAEFMEKAGFDPFLWKNLFLGSQIGGRIDEIVII